MNKQLILEYTCLGYFINMLNCINKENSNKNVKHLKIL